MNKNAHGDNEDRQPLPAGQQGKKENQDIVFTKMLLFFFQLKLAWLYHFDG